MYDFDFVSRKDTDCLKWDLFGDDMPMWVADMDFRAAPPVLDAIKTRAQHPVFAYNIVPDELYDAYISWWDRRYDFKMLRDEMIFSVGVMPSITSIIRAFSDEGDNILIQTPVYHVFFYVIEDNNRCVLENPLIYEDGVYSIDFEDLDKKLADSRIFLLCNPHNPVGKIWSSGDLEKIIELCNKHDVILVSDEIHCDLTDPGVKYNPCSKDSSYKNIITCISPTKTFNIAGIQNSMIHTVNKKFKEILEKQISTDFFGGINSFSSKAAVAAYNESEAWLNELREVIYENKIFLDDFLKNNIPHLSLVKCDATYLMWIDCSKLKIKSEELSDFLKENYGLFLSPGILFGKNGDDFLRMNIACPKELLIKALNTLKLAVDEIIN